MHSNKHKTKYVDTKNYRLWQWWNNSLIGRKYVRTRLERTVYRMMHLKTAPFEHIMIQTNTICNLTCSFCYYGMEGVKPTKGGMDEALFKKIIAQLKEMDYDGRISLFETNEPLTDKRIFDFVRYAKEQVPKSWQLLVSNGVLMTAEKAEKLIRNGVDYLFISAYDHQMYNKCKDIRDSLPSEVGERMTIRALFNKDFAIDNRAGNIQGGAGGPPASNDPCERVNHILYIKPDGKAVSCFGDYFDKNVVGDANTQTVNEIWFGMEFERLRKKLNKGNRNVSEICKVCNIGLPGWFATRKGLEQLRKYNLRPGVLLVGASVSAQMFYPYFEKYCRVIGLVSKHKHTDDFFTKKSVPIGDDFISGLENPEVDFVFIAGPNNEHFEVARKVLEAGRHVLVEKPMTLDLNQLEELSTLAKQKNRVLGGVFQWRFLQAVSIVKKRLEEGAFGHLLFINARVPWRREKDYFIRGRGTREVDGGGVLIKHALHALDLMIFFGGPPLEYTAYLSGKALNNDTEDTAQVSIQFKEGMGTLAATLANAKEDNAEIEIVGSNGRVVFDVKDRFKVWDLPQPHPRIDSKKNFCQDQIQNFVDALKDPEKLVVTPEECRASLEVALEIYTRQLTLNAETQKN